MIGTTKRIFEFAYNLGLSGEFTVDFDKIPAVKTYDIQAGEKELNETLENIMKNGGEQINPESVEDGDMIFGTFRRGRLRSLHGFVGWRSSLRVPGGDRAGGGMRSYDGRGAG